jgi:hypothetical protein
VKIRVCLISHPALDGGEHSCKQVSCNDMTCIDRTQRSEELKIKNLLGRGEELDSTFSAVANLGRSKLD